MQVQAPIYYFRIDEFYSPFTIPRASEMDYAQLNNKYITFSDYVADLENIGYSTEESYDRVAATWRQFFLYILLWLNIIPFFLLVHDRYESTAVYYFTQMFLLYEVSQI